MSRIGFIGLGNIGKPIAERLAEGGFQLCAFDIAGTEQRAPPGAAIGDCCADVAATAEVIFACLPTNDAFEAVIDEIATSKSPVVEVVCNLSTIGPQAALWAQERLHENTIEFADCPISGSAFRATTGDLTLMFAGSLALFARLERPLAQIGSKIFHMGDSVDLGQRMKLVNNYLAISAYVVSAEALAIGNAGGLDLDMMLDVINASSGQNFVTSQMFPRYVTTGTYESGGNASILLKDLSLFLTNAKNEGRRSEIGEALLSELEAFDECYPKTDQMKLFPYMLSKNRRSKQS